jgi:hypothetical protein
MVELELDPRINFALQQNAVPAVKRLRVRNPGSEATGELEVRVTTDPPELAEPWARRLSGLAAGGECGLDDVDLRLSPSYLEQRTERVTAVLWVEVAGAGGVLARRSWPVEVLARDEWGGLESLPESLAAFVLPNHPAVAVVLGRAAARLGENGGDPGLSGYQSRDRARIARMVGGIYGALDELGLTYVNPPASFEHGGQRVRLPGRVVEEGMGTCLDLALLTAGCLEQAGLHPLVLVLRGHAITGVWLDETCFETAAVGHLSFIQNRVFLGEILVLDPTSLTARPSLDFARAVAEGRRRLGLGFECAIDVRRARLGGMRPIPERVTRSPAAVGEPDPAAGADSTAGPRPRLPDASPEGPLPRRPRRDPAPVARPPAAGSASERRPRRPGWPAGSGDCWTCRFATGSSTFGRRSGPCRC